MEVFCASDNQHPEVVLESGNKKQRLHKSPMYNPGEMDIAENKYGSYKHSKSGVIQRLKEDVEQDLDESNEFDKRLQEALLAD